MSSNTETDFDKPSKYLREDNPEHSTLAEEVERKHNAITSPKHIVLKGHPLIVAPGSFNPEFSLIGDLPQHPLSTLEAQDCMARGQF